MLNSGKACSTVSKRTIPHCGLKPQLKECVEHDCYIYTWNSACTMEGIDIVMVRNSLLNDTRCCLECAGGFCLQFWWREDWGLMRLLCAGGLTGENRQGLELIMLHDGCQPDAWMRPVVGRQPLLPHFQALPVLG